MPPTPEQQLEAEKARAEREMAEVDAMPKPLRSLVKFYGRGPVDRLLWMGVTDPHDLHRRLQYGWEKPR